jgi:hypothetical protein
LRFRLPVERGIKEWFFHDEDDPHHVCGWQGREQLHVNSKHAIWVGGTRTRANRVRGAANICWSCNGDVTLGSIASSWPNDYICASPSPSYSCVRVCCDKGRIEAR